MSTKFGTLRLTKPEQVTAGTLVSFSFIYSAGPAGLKAGAKLYIGFDERQRIGVPQATRPDAANYTTAATSDGKALRVEISFVCHGPGSRQHRISEFDFCPDYEPLMTSDYHLVIIHIDKPLPAEQTINTPFLTPETVKSDDL